MGLISIYCAPALFLPNWFIHRINFYGHTSWGHRSIYVSACHLIVHYLVPACINITEPQSAPLFKIYVSGAPHETLIVSNESWTKNEWRRLADAKSPLSTKWKSTMIQEVKANFNSSYIWLYEMMILLHSPAVHSVESTVYNVTLSKLTMYAWIFYKMMMQRRHHTCKHHIHELMMHIANKPLKTPDVWEMYRHNSIYTLVGGVILTCLHYYTKRWANAWM